MELKYRYGFIVDGIFYEDGSAEQKDLLNSPIAKDEEGTLLGYVKSVHQNNKEIPRNN
jgi:hypothetical protein